MSEKISVSVIVPFYNVEKYFTKCLDSIVNQTLKNIEIILIDDCGSDNSIEIAREFTQKDSRIKLIQNKKNSGQGFSRNLGIKIAKGEYVAFVDADDWLEPQMYETLYKNATKNNVDIIRCNFFYSFGKKTILYDSSKFCSDFSKIYTACEDPLAILGYQITTVWNGIYRKEFLLKSSIVFDEVIKYEDMIFSWETMIKAERIMFIEDALYYYLQINNSSDTNTEKYFHYHTLNTKNLSNFAKPNGIYNDAYVLYTFRHLCYVASKRKTFDKKEFKQYRSFVKNYDTSNTGEMIFRGFAAPKIKDFIENNYGVFKTSFWTKIKRTIIYALG